MTTHQDQKEKKSPGKQWTLPPDDTEWSTETWLWDFPSDWNISVFLYSTVKVHLSHHCWHEAWANSSLCVTWIFLHMYTLICTYQPPPSATTLSPTLIPKLFTVHGFLKKGVGKMWPVPFMSYCKHWQLQFRAWKNLERRTGQNDWAAWSKKDDRICTWSSL